MLRQGPLRFLVPGALAVLAGMMTWRLVGADRGAPPATANRAVYDVVCGAAEAERGGDRDVAERRFVDEAHGPLHDVATAAQARDRRVAGRLFEAKQRVEAAVERGSGPLELTALASATRRAVEVADGRDPGDCS